MHRAISGDLQNEEEMDRAMEEAGEEAIYHVRNTVCSLAEQIYRQNKVYPCTYSALSLSDGNLVALI